MAKKGYHTWPDGKKLHPVGKKHRNGGMPQKMTPGKLTGPSHNKGGILLEAEGGEVIVNDSINNAASKHEEELLALNENPDDYMIVPVSDARDRNQIFREGGKVKNKGVK